MLCSVMARTSSVLRCQLVLMPSAWSAAKPGCRCGSRLSISQRKAPPSRKPTTAGIQPGCPLASAISIAGASSDQKLAPADHHARRRSRACRRGRLRVETPGRTGTSARRPSAVSEPREERRERAPASRPDRAVRSPASSRSVVPPARTLPPRDARSRGPALRGSGLCSSEWSGPGSSSSSTRVRATSKKTEKVALIADAAAADERARDRAPRALPDRLAAAGPDRARLAHAAAGHAVGPGGGRAADAAARRRGARRRRRASRAPGSAERAAAPLRALLRAGGRGRPAPARRAADRRAAAGRARGARGRGDRASAAALPPADVRQAAMFAGSVGELARAALDEGAAGLGRFSLRLLSPVAPMLASPAGDAEEALERLGEAAFEYKLDGARLQVHRAGDEVRVFTRHLQDVTAARARGGRVGARAAGARGWSSRARRSPCAPTAVRGRSRRRCAASAGSSDVEAARRELAALVLLLRLPVPRGRGPARIASALRRARRAPASGSSRRRPLLPRIVTRDPDEAERFFERRARRRPRGPDGQVARRALRRRPARLPLAEAEARAHARPRGARGRAGQRPARSAGCRTSTSARATPRAGSS